MSISVVQSVSGGQGASSLNFSSNVTTGNSIVLIAQGYNNSGASSSNPTYNGSMPTGTVKLAELNVTTENVYSGIWLMPNLTGGSKATGITISGGSNGYTAVEIAGLGANPQLDS